MGGFRLLTELVACGNGRSVLQGAARLGIMTCLFANHRGYLSPWAEIGFNFFHLGWIKNKIDWLGDWLEILCNLLEYRLKFNIPVILARALDGLICITRHIDVIAHLANNPFCPFHWIWE